MVVALADMAGLQKVASFTLNNLYKPGDTIHTTYVEDTANSGETSLPVHTTSLDHAANSDETCILICVTCFENIVSSGKTLHSDLKQAL